MIWFVYNCLFAVGYLLMLPYFLYRMARRGGYRRGFMQRFGVYDAALERALAERPRLWVHAVSVGEVNVALHFIRAWRRRQPAAAFALSTTTSTGRALLAKKLAPPDVALYFPSDCPLFVRRALNRIRPAGIILVEGELWPNLLRLARARRIPVAVVNGRMSAKSFRGYQQAAFFFRRALGGVEALCMQGAADGERMRALGVDPARVRVFGSAKYDVAERDEAGRAAALEALRAAGFGGEDLVLLGGSTWAGEEAALLDVYRRLKPEFPRLRLVLAPRHAERAAAVAAELRRRGLPYRLRSDLPAAGAPGSEPGVLLVDTTGELKNLYAAADIVFVGKSLTRRGGQNLIEPALYGKPIVVGPNMENFADVVADFRAADALLQVADGAGLAEAVRALCASPERRLALGRRAAEVVEQRRGAVAATVDALLPLFPLQGAR